MSNRSVKSLAEELRELNAELREMARLDHPDITDRFGRVWVWKSKDLYIHDDILGVPSRWITRPDMQLPNRKLRGNPNYTGLCEICMSEW